MKPSSLESSPFVDRVLDEAHFGQKPRHSSLLKNAVVAFFNLAKLRA
jgi:hypothetical protein